MYRKYNKNRGNKKTNDPETLADDRYAQKDAGQPREDIEGHSEEVENLVRKSFRDLSYKNNVQVAADPHTEISLSSDPYAVQNRNNVVLDAEYPESPNETGNVLVQIARASNSTLQNVVDYFRVYLRLHYNYAKLTPTSPASQSVNDQINNTWLEVQSKLQAESFYSIPFFSWEVTGDTMFIDEILDIVYFYQVFNQAVLTIPLTYRKVLSLEQHVKDMCFYKGAPIVERLYSVLKKSSFVGLIQSAAKAVASNYVDWRWLDQVSLIFLNPSRRFNGMLAPLNEAAVYYEYNDNLTVSVGDTPIFTTSEFKACFDAINTFVDQCSVENILSIARTATYGDFDVNADFINPLVDMIDTIVAQVNDFNDRFNDLNTAFRNMARLGLTDWKQGLFIDSTRIQGDFQPKYNVMLEDVIQALYSGSSSIIYDDVLYKWKTTELLDMYTGIPRYMMKAGGAHLTFSVKDVITTDAPDNVLYPVMFSLIAANTVTRRGTRIPVTRASITLGDSNELSRLIPVGSLATDKVWVPGIDLSLFTTTQEKSWALRFLMGLVGYYQTSEPTLESVDPDKMFFIDIEQEDITNDMLDYIRQNSPFKTLKPTLKQKIGFILKGRN